MARGRPPLGPKLVERHEGSELARKRLQILLESISGNITVDEACQKLGLGPAAFHKLRSHMLEAALGSLAPGNPGRPAAAGSPTDARVAQLEGEIRELRIDLRAAQIREEIALLMPHLMKDRADELKKTKEKEEPSSGGPAGTQPGSKSSGR